MKKNLYSINLAIYNRFQEEMSLGLNDVKKALTELNQEGVLKFAETENKIKITCRNCVDLSGMKMPGLISEKTYFLAIAKGNEFTDDLSYWNKESRVYFLDKQKLPVFKENLTNTDLKKINSKIEQLAEQYNRLLEDPSPDDLE